MGLSAQVGYLSYTDLEDPEELGWFKGELDTINAVLTAHGRPPHEEPRVSETWSEPFFGYSNLHYLRRIAAYVDVGESLPPPGDNNSASDAILRAYSSGEEPPKKGFLRSLVSKPRRFERGFDHLIHHSDCEGYYIPQDFPEVIQDLSLTGHWLGSVQRLQAECERLSRILEIPADISHNDGAFMDMSVQGTGDTLWQRYRMESYACLILREACKISLANGCVIAFT